MLRRVILVALIAGSLAGTAAATPGPPNPANFQARTLDGTQNNVAHPNWGAVGSAYLRIAPASDDPSTVNARYVSNRVFNDLGQNLFSERGMSQYAWVWGQFTDHVFGLAQGGTTAANIAASATDPLERFRNDFGVIPFKPDARVGGETINTVSSYIDAWNVYGGTADRMDWLRNGSRDGNPTDNAPTLMLPGGYLPAAGARGDASSAPAMKVDGQLLSHPQDRRIAGDVRANENIALTAMQTLFAREHNRIVAEIRSTRFGKTLDDETVFQLARRVVGAEEQWITYTEFLPALGVYLPPYRGYKPNVDATVGNEFATVGYRAHSQVHGTFDISTDGLTAEQIAALEALGIDLSGDDVEIPLGLAFFNPDLLQTVGIDRLLEGLGTQRQYKNDEQMDETLRSVLFQVPGTAINPADCFIFNPTPPAPQCFVGTVDLGAIDIQRARDHRIPRYNALRQAFGLPRVTSFTRITGEPTDSLQTLTIDSTNILDFVALYDERGRPVPLGDEENAVLGIRRTTLASRLKALYGTPDNCDAFVCMQAERHLWGSDLGPLQWTMWVRQFTALRDGDRFFYENDRIALNFIKARFGVDYRVGLARLIRLNTDANVRRNLFFASD